MENEVTSFNFEAWKERHDNRIIQQDTVELDGEEYFISTVDLCIPSDEVFSFNLRMPPFETMVFKRQPDNDCVYCRRYYERDHAHEEHKKLIEDLTSGKLQIDDILD